MDKMEVKTFIQNKLMENRICLLKIGFSSFGISTVFLEIDTEKLSVFPEYYRIYFKKHFMETGYMQPAFPYEMQSMENLKTIWDDWLNKIGIIRKSLLKELIQIPGQEKLSTLPEGFI